MILFDHPCSFAANETAADDTYSKLVGHFSYTLVRSRSKRKVKTPSRILRVSVIERGKLSFILAKDLWWGCRNNFRFGAQEFGRSADEIRPNLHKIPSMGRLRMVVPTVSWIIKVDKNFSPFKVEPVSHLLKPLLCHGFAQSSPVLFTIEHEEAPASCAHDLSSEGAIFFGFFIQVIDSRVGYFLRKIPLGLPMLIE